MLLWGVSCTQIQVSVAKIKSEDLASVGVIDIGLKRFISQNYGFDSIFQEIGNSDLTTFGIVFKYRVRSIPMSLA